jgi:hypothetical protein
VRFLGVVIIVLAVLIVIMLLVYAGQQTAKVLRRRADRKVAWTIYTEPAGSDLEIGVRRRTEDGRELSKVHMHTVPAWIELEVLVAMNDAKLRAQQYNEAKVDM